MRFSVFLLLVLLLASAPLNGQGPLSPHLEQKGQFAHPDFQTERAYDRQYRIVSRGERNSAQKCVLKRQVYGWHPFWRGTAYENYDFGLLSSVAYYGCEVDPATGFPADVHQWRETKLVEKAHARGSRVDLCAYLYGRAAIGQLLGDTLRQQVCADTLAGLVREKDADGIILDFQGVDEAMALSFARFVRRMIITLREADPDYQLSLVLPSRDAANGYNAGVLAPYVDRFVVAAYDYRGADAAVAGPVAPLEDGPGGGGSVTATLAHYLAQGTPRDKLLMGIPYFGYRWSTGSLTPGAATRGKGEAVLVQQFNDDYRTHSLLWDSLYGGSYRAWTEGNDSRQVWVDDLRSLSRKIQFVQKNDLAGIGIWALGYDHGSDVLWELIRDRCADCDAAATQKSNERKKILDGPTSAERNQYNWIWILVGMVGLVIILFFVRRMK